MTTTQHDTASLYTVVTTLLRGEESTARPISYTVWQGQRARRAVLEGYIQQLEQTTADLRRRLNALPPLARPEHVHWAQASRCPHRKTRRQRWQTRSPRRWRRPVPLTAGPAPMAMEMAGARITRKSLSASSSAGSASSGIAVLRRS
jgi:hypothetical protein